MILLATLAQGCRSRIHFANNRVELVRPGGKKFLQPGASTDSGPGPSPARAIFRAKFLYSKKFQATDPQFALMVERLFHFPLLNP